MSPIVPEPAEGLHNQLGGGPLRDASGSGRGSAGLGAL